MFENILFNIFPSGFPPEHSTETVPIKALDHMCVKGDASKTSVLGLLDLSAAFDTAD